MTSAKISALPAASALTGAELLAGVQGGDNVKITGDQIRTLVAPAIVQIGTTIVFAGNQASFAFDLTQLTVPSGAMDLMLRTRGLRGSASADESRLDIRFNSDSGNNYDYQQMFTDGASSVGAAMQQAQNKIQTLQFPAANATTNFIGGGIMNILDYAGSGFKEVVGHGGQSYTSQRSVLHSGQWRSTSAITLITGIISAGNFVNGGKASLYAVMG